MSADILNNILDGCILPKEGTCCIYRLLDNLNKVVYVGKTNYLKNRLYQHIMDGKGFISFSYFACDSVDATKLERDEIIKHDPPLNIVLPKTDKYKTIEQAKKILGDALDIKLKDAIESLDIVFQRLPEKNMKHTYVRTDDIKQFLDSLFTNQSNKV